MKCLHDGRCRERGLTPCPLRDELGLVVGVFRFDLEFLLAGFANPVVLAFEKSVVMDALAVVFCAQITLHRV